MTSNDELLVSPELVQRYKDKIAKAMPHEIDMHSKEALNWFRSRISKDVSLSAKKLLNSDYKKKQATQSTQLLGKLFLFQYKAETAGHKETQTYDMFPMVFFFNSVRRNGKTVLYGLNTHYLMPRQRQLLLEALLKIRSSKRLTPNTRIKMTWDVIKAVVDAPIYEKAVHAYRADRFITSLTEVPAVDWPIAVFLNLQKFVHVAGEPINRTDVRRKIKRS